MSTLLSMGCVCRKLDSAILVMKAAENRSRCDGAEPLNRRMNGSVLAQSSMSPRFIIVGGKLAKDSDLCGLTGEIKVFVETNYSYDRITSQRRPSHASHRVSRIEPRHNLNAFVTSDPGACST